MKRIGRRTKMNQKGNRDGDKVIAADGVTSCELRLPGCLGSYMLQRAHRRKRRFCDQSELAVFAILCGHCHTQIEFLSPGEMFDSVNDAILRRTVRDDLPLTKTKEPNE